MFGADICVVFCNTHVQFKETYEFIDQMKEYWGLTNFVELHPLKSFGGVVDEIGLYGIGRFKQACCKYMKNMPLSKWMHDNNKTIAINGTRRSEGGKSKCRPNHIAYSRYYDISYFSPMIFLEQEDIDNYFSSNGLPKNPVYECGYLRTGCAPCPCPNKFYDYYSILLKHHPKWYNLAYRLDRKYNHKKGREFETIFKHTWNKEEK
jgi:phosphoadenosine phosphosulfate reductase